MFLPKSEQVLDAIVETYSDMENSAQVFEIINKIQELKQGNDGVTKYYNTLKGLWKEPDMFYNLEWTCVTNSTHYMKILERDWVFKFLAGLNKELDEVHKCLRS